MRPLPYPECRYHSFGSRSHHPHRQEQRQPSSSILSPPTDVISFLLLVTYRHMQVLMA